MTKIEAVRLVCQRLSAAALLEQLAEESAELSQAALKMARKYRNENPSPVPIDMLNDSLQEEYEDVRRWSNGCFQTVRVSAGRD